MPTWKKDGEWFICNDCGSLNESGQLRKYKCRTSNPNTFPLCDEADYK